MYFFLYFSGKQNWTNYYASNILAPTGFIEVELFNFFLAKLILSLYNDDVGCGFLMNYNGIDS